MHAQSGAEIQVPDWSSSEARATPSTLWICKEEPKHVGPAAPAPEATGRNLERHLDALWGTSLGKVSALPSSGSPSTFPASRHNYIHPQKCASSYRLSSCFTPAALPLLQKSRRGSLHNSFSSQKSDGERGHWERCTMPRQVMPGKRSPLWTPALSPAGFGPCLEAWLSSRALHQKVSFTES